MSDSFLSVGLITNPCYTFNQRMLQCFKKEEFATRMCYPEMEDWFECKSHKKHIAFTNFIANEMRQVEIYSLPVYDEHTDTFKDGRLPRDADDYFAKKEDAKKYYS